MKQDDNTIGLARERHYTVIPDDILRHADLNKTELLVYIILCSRADKEGKCWPGLKLIAKEARSRVQGVLNAIKSLIEKGYIAKKTRKNPKHDKEYESNIYIILDKKVIKSGYNGSQIGTQGSQIRIQRYSNPDTGSNPTEVTPLKKTHLSNGERESVHKSERLEDQSPDVSESGVVVFISHKYGKISIPGSVVEKFGNGYIKNVIKYVDYKDITVRNWTAYIAAAHAGGWDILVPVDPAAEHMGIRETKSYLQKQDKIKDEVLKERRNKIPPAAQEFFNLSKLLTGPIDGLFKR